MARFVREHEPGEACSISVIDSLACGWPVSANASRMAGRVSFPAAVESCRKTTIMLSPTRLPAWLSYRDRLLAARQGPAPAAKTLFGYRDSVRGRFVSTTDVMAERAAPALAR